MSGVMDKLIVGWAFVYTVITVTSFVVAGLIALAFPLAIVAGLLGLLG